MKRTNKGRAASPVRENGEPISELTTNRLSVYLRCLNQLDAVGVRTVSSQALAEQFHLNAAQIKNLMRKGILPRIYIHLLSLENFGRLLERKAGKAQTS